MYDVQILREFTATERYKPKLILERDVFALMTRGKISFTEESVTGEKITVTLSPEFCVRIAEIVNAANWKSTQEKP